MEYISRENLFVWLDGLKTDYEVFVPKKKGARRFYQRYTAAEEGIVIGEARTIEPLKGFFTRVREVVAEDFRPDIPSRKHKPYAIVGVKACDLKGFNIQDQVFFHKECQDPLYARNRQDYLIISTDCSLALSTCFCLCLGIHPYPESHFDINLSEVKDGFIVESRSSKGQQILKQYASLFTKADGERLRQREEARQQITAEVQAKIDEYEVPHQDRYQGMIERNYESSLWQEEVLTCVECGACNTICPTCHCFLLNDQKTDNRFCRFRQWDSCMFKDFSRVAGGGNPRPRLWMRLRNRFEKKFDFFPRVVHEYACTGCGRCITACPAKIDIRRVLKRLVNHE